MDRLDAPSVGRTNLKLRSEVTPSPLTLGVTVTWSSPPSLVSRRGGRSSTQRDQRGRGAGLGPTREVPDSSPLDRTLLGAILFGSFLLVLTLSLISVTIIFCRKRNTVFTTPPTRPSNYYNGCHVSGAGQPITGGNEPMDLIELREFLLQSSDASSASSDISGEHAPPPIIDDSTLLWYHVIANPHFRQSEAAGHRARPHHLHVAAMPDGSAVL